MRRICRLRAAGAKGIFSFAKENIPFGTPRERLRLAVSGLNNSDVSEVKVPRARRSRISIARRFASAPTIRCRSASLVAVQPNSRLPPVSINAASAAMPLFRTQSAAEQTSLAPHDSKARLQDVTICRRFMAKPCTPHPHCAACAVIRATNWQCRGSRGPPRPFSWGCKGDILFPRKRISPFAASPHGVGPEAALPRCTPCALRVQKETALAGCFPPAPEARKLSKLSIWDTYPHFPSFFFG